MSAASITSSSTTNGQSSTWTFSYTPQFETPQSSVIYITFPSWNEYIGASVSTDIRQIIRTTTPACVGTNANIATSLTCSFDSTAKALTISGGFSSGSKTGQVTFTVTSCFNPPHPSALSGFVFFIRSSSGAVYEQSRSTIAVTTSTANNITIRDDLIISATKTVSTSISLTIRFGPTNPLASGSIIEITFPSQITFNSSMNVSGLTGIRLGSLSYTIVSSSVIRITNGYSAYSFPSSIGITCNPITTPSTTKPTDTFSVRTLNSALSVIDSGSGGTFTATSGSITQSGTNAYLSADVLTVGASSIYYFTFRITNNLPAGAAISVVFPPTVSITTRSAGTCQYILTGPSNTAQCEVASKILYITGGFTSGLTAGTIQFGIEGVTNPSSTATTSSFTVSTHPDSTFLFLIDQITTGITLTPQAAQLSSVIVSPASMITGDVTIYTFTIVTTTVISVNGFLTIAFPTGVSISSTSTAQSTCTRLTGFNTNNFGCTCTSSSITVSNGFQSGTFNPGTLSFSIGSIINPPSTKRYQSFTVSTFDSSGNMIDTATSGVFVQVTTANTLAAASISLSNFVNGALSTYTISLTITNTHDSGSKVIVTPPTGVTFSTTSSTCAPVSSNISGVACSEISSNIEAILTLTSTQAKGSVLSFTISNVKNPPTTQPTSTFMIYTYTSDGFFIDKRESGISISTTTAATITDIFIIASDSKIGVTTDYTISYTPSNTHPVGSSITVNIPTEFSVGTLSCTAVTLGSSFSCLSNGKQIITSGGFDSAFSTSSRVTFRISNIINPTSLITTSAWNLVSRSGTFLIDQSSSITSTFTCASVCLTCQTTATTCISCDSASSNPYLYSNTCNPNCPAGQTDPVSTTAKDCVACSSICLSCSETSTKCTSCSSTGLTPYLYADTCNGSCPEGKWGDGTSCFDCTNPCLTCSSSTVCLSCTKRSSPPDFGANTYLDAGVCKVTCPPGSLPNTSTSVCDACNTNCFTCSGTTTYCTSCTGSLKLYNNACTSSCPSDGKWVDLNNVCNACVSPCSTCTGTVNTCTTCVSGYNLYLNSCIGGCPQGTTLVLTTCRTCTSPCDTCSSSVTTCTSCIEGYLIFGTTCVIECTAGFVSDGFQCVACSGCATCSGSPTTCTSCTGKYLLGTTCVDSCPDGTYVPGVGVCLGCDPVCSTCSGTTATCKSCLSGKKLYQNTCVAACPANVSIDNGSSCTACSSSCAQCLTDANVCTQCTSPLLLEEGKCVDACQGGYIQSGTSCLKCNSNCWSCSGTTTNCLSCASNTYLYENWCYTSCPQGYMPSLKVCVLIENSAECAPGCTTTYLSNQSCESACNVAACLFDNGTCEKGETTCASGNYLETDTCVACSYPCNSCSGPSTCLTCAVSTTNVGVTMLFYNAYCYDSCPGATLSNGLTCTACNTRCSSCQGTVDTCLSCNSPFLLYNNQCIANCPADTTITVGLACVDCNSNCKFCSGTTTTCTACPDSRVLQGTTCQVSCNSGFTTTATSTSTCMACSGCLTCSGTQTTCTSCDSSDYLYNSLCVNSCPDGSYPNGNVCSLCDSSCVTCSGPGICLTCASGRFKFGSLCLASCPSGYEDKSGTCTLIVVAADCATGCTTTLLANTVCDSVCNTADCTFDSGKCLATGICAAGQYYDGTTCQLCSHPCNMCNSPSTCVTCSTSTINVGQSMLLYENYCYDSCPFKTMKTGLTCSACSTDCESCLVTTSTCIACPTGKYLYSGACYSDCPSDITVQMGTVCEVCSINCATCSGTFDTCTSCASGRVLMGTTCKSSCDAGYTVTTSSPSTCLICTAGCATCNSQTYSCTSCPSGKYLKDTSCVDTCTADTYVLVGSNCLACQSPCATCSGTTGTCNSCISNYNLYGSSCMANCPNGFEGRLGICVALCADGCTQTLLNNGVCDIACNVVACTNDSGMCVTNAVCVPGQYQLGNTCVSCVSPCNSCSSSAFCTSCLVDSGTNTQMLLYDGKCYLNCPTKTYRNGIICQACSTSCEECSDGSTCTACPTNYLLYKGTCVMSCTVGTSVQIGTSCFDCSNNCAQCSGTVSTCTRCATGTVLSSNTCIAECPAGFTTTTTSNGACVPCVNCPTCLGATTTCTSCSGSLILHESQCIDSCPPGYTSTTAQPSICTACSSSCFECSGTSSYCTSCATGSILTSSNTCQSPSSCPDGTTLTTTSGGVCLNCQSPCINCSGSITSCSSCISGLVLSGTTCVECTSPCKTCNGLPTFCMSCIESYYLSGTVCVACSNNCLSCVDSSFKCTACSSGKFLSGNDCLSCSSTCETCSGTSTACTSCPSTKFLETGLCYSCDSSCLTCETTHTYCTSCSPGFFITSSNECLECSSSCKTCSGSASNCASCDTGFTLIGGVCGMCSSSCSTCVSSFTTCASCGTGLVLLDGKCGLCNTSCLTCVTDFNTCGTCPTGKFLTGGTCIGCDSICKTCSGTVSTCTSCDAPLTLISNTCVSCTAPCLTCAGTRTTCTSCPAGLNLFGSECLACSNSCKTCSGSVSYCTTCYDSYYLRTSTCIECDSNCLTCSGTSTNCLSCSTGSTLVGNRCTQTCSDGNVLVGSNCVPCSTDCKTCVSLVSFCTSCHVGFVYEGDCVTSCATGYFYSSTLGTCDKCFSLCKECIDTSTKCISCNTGYSLSSNTCNLICTAGTYYDGASCQSCSSNCKTCLEAATKCETCPNLNETVSDSGFCEVPCETGFIRLTENGDCIACSSECGTCTGSVGYCSSCADNSKYLYVGDCYDSCPVNITVAVGGECKTCVSPCLTCSGSPFSCLSCRSSTYLYMGTCVSDCPSGYRISGQLCEACQNPNNCTDDGDGDGDGGSTNSTDNSTESSTFTGAPVPFPFSIATVASAGVLIFTKLAATGINLTSSIISVWGLTSALSWVFLAAYIPLTENDATSESRRLMILDPTSGNLLLSIIIILILGALAFHFICNFLFMISFALKACRKDSSFKYWRKNHRCASTLTCTLSTIISFHSIRLLYCGMFNSKSCQANFDDKGKVFKPLIKFGYVSILCTSVPMIIAQSLLLTHYSQSDWMWMFSLDSLVVTALLTFFVFWDIKRMEKDLLRHEWEKRVGPLEGLEGQSLMNPKNSINDLVSIFPQIDFTSLLPQKIVPFKKRKQKYKSKSGEPSRASSPLPDRLYHRKNSFPLLDKDGIEIDIDNFRPNTLPKILDEPYGEEDLLKIPDNSLLNAMDQTVLPEEEDFKGEFQKSKKEYKIPVFRQIEQNYVPLNFDPRTEEFTEIIAFTEVGSESEELEPNMEDAKILLEEEAEIEKLPESPHKTPTHLGTIDAENELDFDRAIADSKDPELVSVPHKPTGGRVRVRKDFKGARIVDLENKVVENLPPVDLSKFDMPMTIVDENDVRYATLVAHSGEKIRVNRNFRGARIVDLEKKVNHPHAYLIGQSVKNEADFQFNNAYPDPEDPEVVVVMHNETGEDVKIRKTFHGAHVVDEHGHVISNQPLIDRNDYDIGRTIVDKEDVHLATLSHKKTNARVKVRRDFRGAKIIDLERKAEMPVNKHGIFNKNEPEPLSPNGSELDFKILDKGWVNPINFDEDLEVRPQEKAKKPPRPIRPLIFGKQEENYDRKGLDTLAEIIKQEENKGAMSERNIFGSDFYQPPRFESEGEDLSYMPSRGEFDMPIHHNLDLEYPLAPDFDYRQEGMLEMNDSRTSINSRNPRMKKRFKKKSVIGDSRMRKMEEIYLQRLEPGKKKDTRIIHKEELDEPEFEQWDRPDSGFERVRGNPSERTLSSAGDEIARGVRRVPFPPPRRDY